MRIWSLHPRYLDSKGLVALWREALLAQAVLLGRTRGYTRHPQLDRFHAAPSPVGFLGTYLRAILEEAATRGYRFDAVKITTIADGARLAVTIGQMEIERRHLLSKLAARDPERMQQLIAPRNLLPHPLFDVVPGDVEPWERAHLPAPSSREKISREST